MNETTNIHDTDEPTITVGIDVKIPAENARAFFEALTGDDEDVLLAAERAIRERLDVETTRQVELAFQPVRMIDFEGTVERLLAFEADTNERREALYGPTL